MDIALLTRSVTFTAAHRDYRPEWDDARYRQVFGAHVEYSGGAEMPA